MQLRDDPIQGILPPMRFTFIFPIIGGLIGISSEILVSTVSVVADDVLRAPPMVVLTSSDPRQFDSQTLSLFNFHRCGSRRDYSFD